MTKQKLDSLAEIKNRLRLRDVKKGTINDEDLEIIYSFAEKAMKDFGGFIHDIILFGAVSRGEEGADLDILVLVDDVSTPITEEVIGAYRLGMGQILVNMGADDRIHLTTIGIADFWDGVRQSDPVIVNIIRDGKAIVDTGFFKPLKKLLEMGRIKPSPESIEAHVNKARSLLNSVDFYMKVCLDNLYWATMDAAHAFLMAKGESPPSPKEIPNKFSKIASKTKGVTKWDAKFVKKMYKTMKKMTKSKKAINPTKIKKLRKRTEKFVKKIGKKI